MGKLLFFFLFSYLVIGAIADHLEEDTALNQELPTVYEYFATPDGQTPVGLVAESDGFKLNNKTIRIISGAMHYWRIHPSLWRDRLRKLRASGANTVETYVPWNLHEPIKDQFDFGEGDEDSSLFLDVRRFVQMAQEEDLLMMFRPGPYICTEFEFGGLPSYLLRDPNMKVRTGYQPYLDRVKIYLDALLPHVVDLQFSRGGPIIALQLENEYASFDEIDPVYLELIRDTYFENGIDSLLFTSDGSWNGEIGSLPGILKTANFGGDAETNLNDLLAFQPDKPCMVMEFWCGWFDHWFENHSTTTPDDVADVLEVILGPYNGSVNFYMFHGGTNFGFNAGANHVPEYAPDITSYDYDAPLSEAGDYTAKYYKVLQATAKYGIPALRKPPLPAQSRKIAYPSIGLDQFLTFSDILDQVPSSAKFTSENRVSMENLDMNEGSGQKQGYILYRKTANLTAGVHTFAAGRVRDFGLLLVNGELQPFPKDENGTTMYWLNSLQEYDLNLSAGEHTFDLFIENMGRVNFGAAWSFVQHKGLAGNLTETEYYHLDSEEIMNIEIIALEFKSKWVTGLTGWEPVGSEELKAPVLLQSQFTLTEEEIADTFIDMSSWTKGIVFINGFNLGRYFNVGPQQTLYLPSPFLRSGVNTITIFEQMQPGEQIRFSATPNLGPTAVLNVDQLGVSRNE